jgi:hypothetical protein
MRSTLKLMAVCAFALLVSVPATFAQTPEVSTLPVSEPLDVGGTILQPGVYAIRVLPSITDRNKVQVTSADLKTVYATVLTVPHPLEPNEKVPNTMFIYYPAEPGRPRALRTWFAQNPVASQGGHDIVYEEGRAKQLARLTESRVVSYQAETTAATYEDTQPLQIVTPEATIETYTYTAPVAPAPVAVVETTEVVETPVAMTSATTDSEPVDMPATGSDVPLAALLGVLSVGGAVALRMTRSE